MGLTWNLDEGLKELNLTTCRSHFKFNLGQRTVLVIIMIGSNPGYFFTAR